MMDEFVVASDPSSPSHQKTLVLQVEVGEVKNSSVHLPPSSPTPHTQNFSVGLHCEFDGYNEVLSLHPPSFGLSSPLYCDLFFSPISSLPFDVHEDQVFDGVCVE